MAKKKFNFNLKFSYDAPVTLTFVLISAILFILSTYVIKSGAVSILLASPTSQTGNLPFIVKQPLSYLRLLLYIFGSSDINVLLSNLIMIVMLGPAMEERYGSVIIGLMIFVSALFSGVLNACFSADSLLGALPVICMMVFLNAFMAFSKKTVPLTFIFVIVLIAFMQIFSGTGAVKFFICIAGGLCGSLFAFLTSPKVKAAKKNADAGNGRSGGLLSKAEKLAYAEELDKQSPRNKKNRSSSYDDDETTVVGTLRF
ncbi:MAG: rhomboid family intramembrane serine protease [Treponema sp.]|nr:rhomboid family intramembrane serine protease [Treponema sp.]